MLQMMSEGAARRIIILPYLSCINKRAREGCGRSREAGTMHSGRDGEGPVLLRKPKDLEEQKIVRKISSPTLLE